MYTILNDPASDVNAAAYEAQARPDKGDTDVWSAAWNGTGVVSGCAVTENAGGADMSVDVASGVVLLAGAPFTIGSMNLEIAAADPVNGRTDLVTVDDSGDLAVVTGAAAGQPMWPTIPAGSLVLATVFVPGAATEVLDENIVDKRVVFGPRSVRQTASVTTGSLANAASEQTTITIAKGYRLLAITTDRAARVRLYDRAAKRTADASRPIGDPLPVDSGLVLEYVSEAGALTATMSPEVDGHSMEASPGSAIPITITNLSGSTSTVTVGFTWVQTE